MNARPFLKYWLPVLMWMALIFVGSSGVGSTRNTSRIIGPFLRWLHPGITTEAVHRVEVAVRKTGHLSEYAVLAALLWRARRKPQSKVPRPWTYKDARWAVIAAMLYAAVDETHQMFVPGRQASPWDVMIDTIGAVIGLTAIWAVGRRWKQW